ncbi:chemotaxis protein CheW [uncultured Alsobacter sp.]|uniref:chemotaxis protein CheW n=1 Tax=uncultured Alsobacter sp. TaxID=1748258 RepID=UPI0025F64C97|nr:chemotaxis protein CheW [uncultured Alsobacter sp.]
MSAALRDYSLQDHESTNLSQVVTFTVHERLFGTPVSAVREIRGWQPATALPNAEPHVLGVLNLRGSIIVVYDLRSRLGLGSTERTRSTVTIVVDAGERLVGLLADAVSDILDVEPEDLRDPPVGVMDSDDGLLDKLIVKNDTVISLLNINAIVGA